MARSTTRNPRKTRSSATASKKKPSKATMENPNEETSVMKSRDMNVDVQHVSVEAKTTKGSKSNNRRPPLPRGKANKKRHEKEGNEKEEEKSDEDESPLKKRKLLGRATAAIAIAASAPGRPRRRAATGKKKQYSEADSDTDDETSSDDDSDYGNKKDHGSQVELAVSGKTMKRKRGADTSKTSNAKKAKTNKSSSQATTKAFINASPAAKKMKSRGSPAILSTPQGANIGLTPIKDSVSKVWKNDGVDWRVLGAIDYGFD